MKNIVPAESIKKDVYSLVAAEVRLSKSMSNVAMTARGFGCKDLVFGRMDWSQRSE